MLASTGVAGEPVEHFNLPADSWSEFVQHYHAISKIDPLGIKTSYDGLMSAIAHVGRDEFCHTPCVWLRRRDTSAQAVSNYRAMVTGQWLVQRGEPVIPVDEFPDLPTIRQLQAEYEDCNQRLWPAWFQEMGITPLTVWYEEMCQAPQETVRAICQFLEFPDPSRIDVGILQQQRDAMNDQWRERLFNHV